MAFRLRPDQPLATDLDRIIDSQVTKALHAIDEADRIGIARSVHEVRQRCKKLRAAARLVRPAVGDAYEPTNAAFRDAARLLSDARDAQVQVAVFDDLLAATPEGFGLPDLRATRRALRDGHAVAVDRLTDDRDRFDAARALIVEARSLTDSWDVGDDDAATIAAGVGKTYKRVTKRYQDCLDNPSTERLHEWRKRVKYHRHHLRMLQRSEPVLLDAWEHRFHQISDALGDDHDLAVLVDRLHADSEAHGGDDAVDVVTTLAEGRRADLQSRALSLGAVVCGERRKTVVARLSSWWEAACDRGSPPQDASLEGLTVADELTAATADELRRRASDLDVSGRSTMTRSQLEGAVRAARDTQTA